LPFVDVVIADGYDKRIKVMAMGPIPAGWRILDIGRILLQHSEGNCQRKDNSLEWTDGVSNSPGCKWHLRDRQLLQAATLLQS
jgi:hypothetical protein